MTLAGRGGVRPVGVLDSCPATSTDSMTTGGGLVLRWIWPGLTDTTPATVGNQSVPSGVRHAAGCEPKVHSVEGKPSRLS